MPDWNYGDAYLRHPCDRGIIEFDDGSMVCAHDIFNPLPEFMGNADLIFTDSPWNTGNLKSFYTKAGIDPSGQAFERFYHRLFECVAEIRPKVCYLEIGKEYLANYIVEMRRLYPAVTFYNTTYYHASSNLCYVVRGGAKRAKRPFDNMDEESVIEWICKNEEYDRIGDLCMGRGLVGLNAYINRRRFVGTELNHRRLSVLVENIVKAGGHYHLWEESKCQ